MGQKCLNLRVKKGDEKLGLRGEIIANVEEYPPVGEWGRPEMGTIAGLWLPHWHSAGGLLEEDEGGGGSVLLCTSLEEEVHTIQASDVAGLGGWLL